MAMENDDETVEYDIVETVESFSSVLFASLSTADLLSSNTIPTNVYQNANQEVESLKLSAPPPDEFTVVKHVENKVNGTKSETNLAQLIEDIGEFHEISDSNIMPIDGTENKASPPLDHQEQQVHPCTSDDEFGQLAGSVLDQCNELCDVKRVSLESKLATDDSFAGSETKLDFKNLTLVDKLSLIPLNQATNLDTNTECKVGIGLDDLKACGTLDESVELHSSDLENFLKLPPICDAFDEDEPQPATICNNDQCLELKQLIPSKTFEGSFELKEAEFKIVREDPYLAFDYKLKQQTVEILDKLVTYKTDEAERIKLVDLKQEVILDSNRKTVLDVKENLADEEFNLVIVHNNDKAKALTRIDTYIESEFHKCTDNVPDISEPSIGDINEDLELELDNEPMFERRQVQVKRDRDPRREYELGDELGKGRFGIVYRCTEHSSGRKLAAKFIHMRRREDREDVEREVEIMSCLQHKRLLQLYDAFDDGKNEMCLIAELVEGGELFERIVNDDFELTEKKAAIFVRQICEGVEYMHKQNIVHLDMKPENILCISKSGIRIKLIDFGLARRLSPHEPLRVMFGTPDFAAPEVLAYDIVSLATDMWSVGVICYVLLSGLSPFMGDNDMETMANVTRATYDFDDEAFEPISELAKDFISKLLVREQIERLRPDECLQHAWLQRGGAQLEASVRRQSMALLNINISETEMNLADAIGANTPPTLVSLDKRNLKKYVVRRKWHKTVHAIMALGRMGANLKLKLSS